jgi:site-specific recombinase XerD
MRPTQNPNPDAGRGCGNATLRRSTTTPWSGPTRWTYASTRTAPRTPQSPTNHTWERSDGGSQTTIPTSLYPKSMHTMSKAFLLALAARGIAPGTRSTMMWALRSFYRYLLSEQLVVANPNDNITVPGSRKIRTEFYTDTEADHILAGASQQNDLRWQVGYPVLATLRYGGLRRNEIATLRLDQVDLPARRITVTGKGNKTRIVPIPAALLVILTGYLTTVRPTLPASAFFFANPDSRPGGAFVGRFNHQGVDTLVKAAGTGAGLGQRDFAHRWRHTYATSLLRRGTDIYVVQRVLGHSSINTTTRYLHLDDNDLLDAVDKAFPDE